MIAESVQDAVSGLQNLRAMHMLYAGDLTLLACALGTLQTMLNGLTVYSCSKHKWLTANARSLQIPHHKHCNVRGCPLQLKAVVLRHPFLV